MTSSLGVMAAAAKFMTGGRAVPVPVPTFDIHARRRFSTLVEEARRAGLLPRGTTPLRINRLAEYQVGDRFAYIELLPDGHAYVLVTDERTFTECWEFTPEETYLTVARLHRLLYNTPE